MRQRNEYDLIQPATMQAMERYRDHHIPVGSFLQAVIRNDLGEACARADVHNLWIIPIIVYWFYFECPGSAYGSIAKYNDWISQFRSNIGVIS